MSKDPFNLDMTIPALIDYVKKCPKIYAHELPDKVEKYICAKTGVLGQRLKAPESIDVTVTTHEEIAAALIKMKNAPIIPILDRTALRTDMTLKGL